MLVLKIVFHRRRDLEDGEGGVRWQKERFTWVQRICQSKIVVMSLTELKINLWQWPLTLTMSIVFFSRWSLWALKGGQVKARRSSWKHSSSLISKHFFATSYFPIQGVVFDSRTIHLSSLFQPGMKTASSPWMNFDKCKYQFTFWQHVKNMIIMTFFNAISIVCCSQVMTGMGEEPVSEQEFQDFAKVVVTHSQYSCISCALVLAFAHPVTSDFGQISGP